MSSSGSTFWDDLSQDARYALRQLGRNPAFAGAAVVTLAVGIGANSAVFSVVSGVLLEPLPYEQPAELVTVSTAFPTQGFDRFWVSPPEFYELREWNQVFEDLGAYRVGNASVETLDRPLRVPSAVASWTLFTTLGVRAELGRTFLEEEDRVGAQPTALISHGLWQRGFGADPGIVGSTVRVSGQNRIVVGVLPEGFDIEDAGVDIWQPMNETQQIDPADHANRRGNHFMNVVARVRDGVTPEMVGQDIDRLYVRWGEEYGDTHRIGLGEAQHPMFTTDLRAELLGDARPALLLVMGAVSFVLLIACANVANLLLARSESRAGEIAVRVAMGAGRGRMTRQLVTEGLALSLVGAALGLVLAHFGTRLLLSVNPDAVPRAQAVGLDARVVAFTALVAVGTGVLFGLAPLLSASMQRVGATLKQGGTRATRGSAGVRMRRSLVVAEIAFAVVLLVGSGLMLRSIAALRDVDLGFDAENALTFTVALPPGDYPEPASVGQFFAGLLSELRALPGVVAATATSGLPPTQVLVANDTEFEGVPMITGGPPHNVDYYTAVEESYFETMGIPIVDGRGFESSDVLSDGAVLIVNERVASALYPGESPIGRRIRPGGNVWFTVIGVAGDVNQSGVSTPPSTELFFFNPQTAARGANVQRTMSIVVRTERAPLALASAVERIVRELDPALPVANLQTLEQNVAGTMAQPRFLTLLLGVFAGVALLLASVGTYGVMAHTVAERNREIGIRMAMGAEPESVRILVLRQGAALAAAGLALGVAGAFALTRFLGSQLYGVGTTDLRTFVVVPVVLGAVALVACYVPARRATRIDPVHALREA